MLIELIKDYIKHNIKSIDLEFGDNLFINFYPDEPDTIVSVIDMGGYPPPLYYKTREKVIEFKFRAKEYTEASKIGNELFNLFHDKENYYLEDKRILHSYARTEVSYLYNDSNNRQEFSLEVVFLMENRKD